MQAHGLTTNHFLVGSSRIPTVAHYGSLMFILSVKSAGLEPDLWRLKARIMFRGDDMSAVFEELYASSPSYLAGLTTLVAFGLLDGHPCTMPDASRAYVQAALQSKDS